MQEYRPPWGSLPDRNNQSPKQSLTTTHTIKIKQIHERTQQSILHTPNTFNEHNTTTQLRKRPIRQRALQGRHSCIAQGEMRPKPDMKPWVNADKRMKRALKGRHSCKAQGGMRAKPDMEPWVNANKRMKRALKGRHSCKAQGGIRAKPDMKPWVNANKRMKRSLQGRHSCKAQGGIRAKPDMKPWVHTDKRMKRALQGRHLPTQANAPTSTKYCHTHQDDYICVVQNIIQYGTIHFSTLCAFSFSYCI